jgi:tRNA(Ile)-lysidine synthase
MDSANLISFATVKEELKQVFANNPASCYLIATSGGKDSMLLCELMLQMGLSFEIIHVNYGLRGSDSEADQLLVEKFCQKNNITFHLKRSDLKLLLNQQPGNLQAEARKIRYTFFKEIQSQRAGSLVCTAHHANDLVETFWLQLARGAGIKGLAAMKITQKGLLRPLLSYSRETVDSLARELKITWREDSSNTSLKYRRNLWRNELLPFLRNELPQIDNSVLLLQNQFSREISEQQQIVEEQLSQLKKNQSITLDEISQLTVYQFIELFKLFEIPTHVIQRLPALFKAENGKFIEWQKPYTHLKFFAIKHKAQILFMQEEEQQWDVTLQTIADAKGISAYHADFAIDYQQINGTLFFRVVQPGDRIRVKGMKGSKKVLQVLKEVGVPAPIRKQQYVLCDAQQVIAIPNIQLNASVKAEEQTTQIAILHFSKKQ